MNRREFLKSAAVTSAGVAALGTGSGSSAQKTQHTPPNILFIMCDELRFPSVFPSGLDTPDQWYAQFMPNVYGLWKRGVKFTSHYTAANACSPARGTLLTGLYSHQTWLCETMSRNSRAQPALNPAFPTWAKLLRQQGYQTAWAGKWHVSHPSPNGLTPYGFDEQLVTPDPTGANLQGTYGDEADGFRNDQDIADAASQWLSQRNAGRPWVLAASFVNPHDHQAYWAGTEWLTYNNLFDSQKVLKPMIYYSMDQGQPHPPFVSWAQDAVKTPSSYGYPEVPPNWESAAQLAAKPSTQLLWRNVGSGRWGGATDDSSRTDFSLIAYPDQPADTKIKTGIGVAPFSYWQRSLNVYTWLCNQVDKHIGQVLSAMPNEAKENTIIVFTSDHGDYASAHGILSGKTGTCYEEAFHIPLIIVDPTRRYATDIGTARTGLTSSVDLLPLLTSLASGSSAWMTGDLQGLYGKRLDMLAMLRSAQAPGRPYVVFTTDEVIPGYYNPKRHPIHAIGLRTKDWKLGQYTTWLPGTLATDPAVAEIEYYDYSAKAGRLELDSNPEAAAAKAAQSELIANVIPDELRQPLPPSLSSAQAAAAAQLARYLDLVEQWDSPMNPGRGEQSRNTTHSATDESGTMIAALDANSSDSIHFLGPDF